MRRSFLESNFLAYILLSFSILLGSILVTNNGIDTASIHIGMLFLIILPIICIIGIGVDHRIDANSILLCIIFIGCVMRIGYTLYNGVFCRTHDTWYYDDYSAHSKSTYLMWILERQKLPDTYEGQLYHQPFSYIMSALSCKLMQPFLINKDIYYLGAVAGKLSNCFASCGILFLVPKLGKEFSMKSKSILLFTWLVATFPGFYFIAGRIGEDAFSCFFALAEILYTVKWYKNSNMKNTILLAVFFGLGLQTNLSCILPAIFTLCVVIIKLLRNKNELLKYIKEILIFCVVAIPLGLWFYIRNYLKFKIPFTYVNRQIVGGPNWTGNVSLWKRYSPFEIQNILTTPYALPYDDYNLPVYFLKSELFGEFTFEINNAIPYTMLLINIVITIIAIIHMVKVIFSRKAINFNRALAGLMIIYIIFEMYSYYKEPFGCSMDARYFLIMTIIKILFFTDCVEEYAEKQTLKKQVIVNKVFRFMALVFGTSSIVMFCIIN